MILLAHLKIKAQALASFHRYHSFQLFSKLWRVMQPEGKRAIASTEGKVAAEKLGTALKCVPNPSFLIERLKLFDQIYARNAEEFKSILYIGDRLIKIFCFRTPAEAH